MITDPWGTTLAGAGDNECIISSEIDIDELKAARNQFPVLSDRTDWLNKAGKRAQRIGE
jgi:predicted amidohydrolase